MGRVVTKTPHTVNGKFMGMFYVLDDGRKLYLAHRSPSKVDRKRMAWVLGEPVLRQCRAEGFEAVGVALRLSGKPMFYLSPLDDWYGDKSFSVPGYQRGLPLKWFKVHPTNNAQAIEKLSSLGR